MTKRLRMNGSGSAGDRGVSPPPSNLYRMFSGSGSSHQEDQDSSQTPSKDNNNSSKGGNPDSLLSQALEKPMSFAAPSEGAGVASAGGVAGDNPFNGSDASDDEASVDAKMPAPPTTGGVFGNPPEGGMGGMPAAAAAAAAQAAAAGLFPPGLEALYRQAGFPPFLGLGPAGLNRSGSSDGSGGSGGSGLPPSSSAGGMVSPPPPPPPAITHGGLQSHANNPTSKSDFSKYNNIYSLKYFYYSRNRVALL